MFGIVMAWLVYFVGVVIAVIVLLVNGLDGNWVEGAIWGVVIFAIATLLAFGLGLGSFLKEWKKNSF